MNSKTTWQSESTSARERAHDWVLRLESEHASDRDRLAFETWLSEDLKHQEDYANALSLRDTLQQLRVSDLDEDIAERSRAEKVTAFFDELSSIFSMWLSDARLGVAAALSIAVILIVSLQPLNQQQVDTPTVAEAAASEYNTAIGEVRTFKLRDNTTVTLGAASSISVIFSTDKRTVELNSGEAYFDVTPNPARPFAVQANTATATAIGTAFDVRRNGMGLTVAVAEGMVEVSRPLTIGGKETSIMQRQLLSAGEQASVSENGDMQALQKVAPDMVGAWRAHKLIYKGATLWDVINDANRYSEVPIEIQSGQQAIGELQVRGVFLGSDIERLLETIGQILPVQLDYGQEGKILVKEKS